jgi:hypothetical protein
MKKFLLIASVAAMAVTAPAAAEREGRGERGQRAERAQQGQQQQAERRSARQQQQATDRGADRRQQMADRRAERQQQASDRRSIRQQAVSDRRARVEQAQSERRAARQHQVADRQSRRPQADSDRRARAQQIASDRRARIQQQRSDRQSLRQQAQSDRRSRIDEARSDRRTRIQQMQADRRSAIQQVQSDRRSLRQQAKAERRALRQQARSDRREAFKGDDVQWRQQAWQRQAERTRVLAERRERLSDGQRTLLRDRDDDNRTFFRIGQAVSPTFWYDDYVPLRYASYFDDDDRYYYRYDGDYLYRLDRDDNVVLSLFPLLGGAYAVGNPLPFYRSSTYNVPWGYDSLYYDTPDSHYRYGDSAIYRVDPTTQLIAGIVALLTGQNLGIGQMLPTGFDAYNVPYAYRDDYYDTDDRWYRYDDGYIYGVDPYTRRIESRYPVYGDYMVGSAWPSYAGYDYGVPDYYGDLYYQQPNYDYRFASGGIYQVDPATQLVTALVALVTGQNFAVGQPLPLGYDVYNVPYAYRDDYFDDDDNWYRYADGRIYQVDPDSRLIRRVIMV